MSILSKDLSVIITALNEEGNILDAITAVEAVLKDFQINGEIIIVNDGSTDRTAEIVNSRSQKDSSLKVINHAKPRGVGASFWDGVDLASGEVAVWMPGDNENDPAEILRHYKLMRDVDMVIPFVSNKDARPFLRNLISSLYRRIINLTFQVNFRYTNGTNLYRTALLKKLNRRSYGFLFQADILVRLARQGCRFAEVPYKLKKRASGASKAFSLRSLLHVTRDYFRLVFDCYL
jgi:dolichol-phosphate mannosyltransferase